MRFFIFEVTNPVEVRAGGKASFIERGPYSYTETREKINISSESEGRNHIRQMICSVCPHGAVHNS